MFFEHFGLLISSFLRFSLRNTGNALRVSRAVTRLTVYRPLQVREQCRASFAPQIQWQIRGFCTLKFDGVKSFKIVLRSDNFPKQFRMSRISHAKNQLCGYYSFWVLQPDSLLKIRVLDEKIMFYSFCGWNRPVDDIWYCMHFWSINK